MVSNSSGLVGKANSCFMIKEILFYWGEIAITTVLVTGAKGQLGSELVLLLNLTGYKVFGMGIFELDNTKNKNLLHHIMLHSFA